MRCGNEVAAGRWALVGCTVVFLGLAALGCLVLAAFTAAFGFGALATVAMGAVVFLVAAFGGAAGAASMLLAPGVSAVVHAHRPPTNAHAMPSAAVPYASV